MNQSKVLFTATLYETSLNGGIYYNRRILANNVSLPQALDAIADSFEHRHKIGVVAVSQMNRRYAQRHTFQWIDKDGKRCYGNVEIIGKEQR